MPSLLVARLTSRLRTGTQQVDHVQMMSDMDENFQLWHQCAELARCGALYNAHTHMRHTCCHAANYQYWISKTFFNVHFYTKLLLEDLEYENTGGRVWYMRAIVRNYDMKRTYIWQNETFILVKRWPLSILTATVVHVVAFSMPKAAASTTCPNAPRPSGSPWVTPEYHHQQNILCRYNFRIVLRTLQDTWLPCPHPAWVCPSETPICWHHRSGVRTARPWACPPSPGSWTGSLSSNLHHWAERERERVQERERMCVK